MVGDGAIFNFTAIQQNPNIPICLPKKRPNAMPSGIPVVNEAIADALITTPAFMKANNGKMKKATDPCKSCSNSLTGERLSLV